MNDEISHEQRGRDLSSKFRSTMRRVVDMYNYLGEGAFGKLLNAFAFAIDDNEIEALSGRVIDQEANTVEIAVFTKDHVIYFNGESNWENPRLRVFARSSLADLTLVESPPVVPIGASNRFSRWAVYELEYSNGIKFQVPFTPGVDGGGDDFAKLLTSLLDDLDK